MVKITATIKDRGTVQKNLTRIIATDTRRKLEQAGREMAEKATELMGASFDLNRPFERRRHPGSRRAATAIDYNIDGSGDQIDFTLAFRILGGEEVFLRVIGLNFGTGGGHDIDAGAGGGWALRGVSNPIRTRSYGARSGPNSLLAFPDGGEDVFTRRVHHPGTAGAHFLEAARDQIVREIS